MLRCRGGIAVSLLAVVAAGCGGAPEDVAAPAAPALDLGGRVEAYLKPWVERGDFKGVVRIARGDEILVDVAWGLAPPYASGEPHEALFRIGSLTKPFNAAAILMLRDAGKLSLDDTLDRFLPGFPSAERITIQQLLTHGAGVPDPDSNLFFSDEVDLDTVLKSIADKPLLFEPGTSNRYSNGGYNVLARVIEVASGEAWESYLARALFEPLGLRSTGNFFGPVAEGRLVAGFLPGPRPGDVVPAPRLNMGAAIGSGSLASTIADLHRWGLAVADRTLFSFEGLSWPVGWGKLNVAEHAGLEQTAVLPGYSASIALFPDDRLVVLCLNAVESGDWIRWAEALAGLAWDVAPPPTEFPEIGSIAAADRARLVGRYRSEERGMRIEDQNGLWMFLGEWPVGKYLTPTADGGFFPRAAQGKLRFEPEGTGAFAERVRWVVRDTEIVFERVTDEAEAPPEG
jgi:CubicO group peptidase (beta-lactamase class C family)